MSSSFRLNAPDVTCEVFDGEALVVNLRSGAYYSLRETALIIWQMLLEGWPAADIGRRLAPALGLAEAQAVATVEAFVTQLQAEALIVSEPARQPATTAVTWPERIGPPVLDRYSDMEELLKLDPIHEVDVAGWPVQPPTPPKA